MASSTTTTVVVEWTKVDDTSHLSDIIPDVTVYVDGRLRVGARFNPDQQITWHQLSPEEQAELHRFIFIEQDLLSIEPQALKQAAAAIDQGRAQGTEVGAISISTQMDADTTIIQASDQQQSIDIQYYDLFSRAQRYPEVDGIQRLRNIEQYLLALAQKYSPQP